MSRYATEDNFWIFSLTSYGNELHFFLLTIRDGKYSPSLKCLYLAEQYVIIDLLLIDWWMFYFAYQLKTVPYATFFVPYATRKQKIRMV